MSVIVYCKRLASRKGSGMLPPNCLQTSTFLKLVASLTKPWETAPPIYCLVAINNRNAYPWQTHNPVDYGERGCKLNVDNQLL